MELQILSVGSEHSYSNPRAPVLVGLYLYNPLDSSIDRTSYFGRVMTASTSQASKMDPITSGVKNRLVIQTFHKSYSTHYEATQRD